MISGYDHPHRARRERLLASHRRLAMVDVPPFADGAVAELSHGADGTVIAEIRIPGPAGDHGEAAP